MKSTMTSENKNFVEQFFEYCMLNKQEAREYYHDIKETREYSSLPEIQKIVNTAYASFCMNNGLWNNIKKEGLLKYLEDEDKMFYNFLHLQTELPNNRYRQHLLQHYYSGLDTIMKDLKMEDLKDFKISDYYSKKPPISVGLEKLKEIKI